MNKTLAAMAEEVTAVNQNNGWHDRSRTFGDECALIHSEVSEMLEEFREGRRTRYVETRLPDGVVTSPVGAGQPYPAGLKPVGVPSEAADILIRLLDFCHREGIDLQAEYEAKIAFNKTRGHRHGGKAL